MGITIEAIKENEYFEYKGDVHVTGNVGKKATIKIKDGNLIIDGDVENNAAGSSAKCNTCLNSGQMM